MYDVIYSILRPGGFQELVLIQVDSDSKFVHANVVYNQSPQHILSWGKYLKISYNFPISEIGYEILKKYMSYNYKY